MSFKITADNLRRIAGAKGKSSVIDALVEHLPEVMDKYNIDTLNRAAHFLGQLAHESDHFNTFEEYASGQDYEGRRDLGNVKRGDGRRYKGRGPIQITGRYNYRKYGNILDVDLENNPELASSPRIGTMIAGEYWHRNGLNQWADKDNVKQVTLKINGGYNGLADRKVKVERAKRVLSGVDFEDLQDGLDEAPVEVATKPVAFVSTPEPVAPVVIEDTVVSEPINTGNFDVIDGRVVPKESPVPMFVQQTLFDKR